MLTLPPCDLLVVGAGPAGSCAAMTAASRGVSTLLIDAKSRIGEPPHCGEFVPARLFAEYNLDRGCIMNRVEVMETRVVDSEAMDFGDHPNPREDRARRLVRTSDMHSPGFIIDRVRFDRDLASVAAARGALVLSAARLVKRDGDAWVFSHRQETYTVQPRLVIAADGATSTVAAALHMQRPAFLRGIQVEAPLDRPSDRCLIYLDRSFVGGYGWVFPKKTSANVGLGIMTETPASPSKLLREFVQRLTAARVIVPGTLAHSAGVIPVSGIRCPLVQDNVLFCGDAAGLTHPITGAGIPQAVVSGTLAGHYAAEAFVSRSDNPLQAYEREIRTLYQGVIGHARSKREVLARLWHEPDFVALCDSSWIGFHGYRKRVRS